MLNLIPISSLYNSDHQIVIENDLQLRATHYIARQAKLDGACKPKIIEDRLLSLMLRDAKRKAMQDSYQSIYGQEMPWYMTDQASYSDAIV